MCVLTVTVRPASTSPHRFIHFVLPTVEFSDPQFSVQHRYSRHVVGSLSRNISGLHLAGAFSVLTLLLQLLCDLVWRYFFYDQLPANQASRLEMMCCQHFTN